MKSLGYRETDRWHLQLLLRWRWLILAIGIPFSIVIELIEGQTTDLQFLDEVIIDGLVLPVSTWIVLTVVARRAARQIDRAEEMERRQHFVQRLAEHRDFHDLARFIVRYPSTQLPIVNAALFVHGFDRGRLELVAEWRKPGSSGAALEHSLVLLRDNVQVGVLRMGSRLDEFPSAAQLDLLAALAPEMAQALDIAIADSRAAEEAYREAQAYERRRIMQELHDSLAQQVFYLHLGLDQLIEEQALGEDDSVRRKIESMREVAADVYDQIRHNLSILRAWEQVDLTEAVSDLARVTAQNAGLTIEIGAQGTPKWLSPHTCEHIYGVIREALNNTVKHAQAQHVRLNLDWTGAALRIELSDDGVGFDPAHGADEGHYGLALMREAVESLHGTLAIESVPGTGTRLRIEIPHELPAREMELRRERIQELYAPLEAAR